MEERRIAFAARRWAEEHRSVLIEDLKGLLSIRSVASYGEKEYPMGSGCARAVDYLLSLGERYKLTTENDEYYCACIVLPGHSNRELGILGHLDTVPEGDGWRFPPFAATEKNGCLIARGSRDNKGPVMMALYVLRCFRELGIPLDSSIRLIAGCDEERETRDVRHYLSTHSAPEFTLNCDGAWAVCIAEKGIVQAELEAGIEDGQFIAISGGGTPNQIPDQAYAVLADENKTRICITGRAAHCSTPHRGDNAIPKLLEQLSECEFLSIHTRDKLHTLLQCIADYEGTGLRISFEDKLSGKTTCAPTCIRFENGKIHVLLNIRYSIAQNAEVMLQRFQKRCDSLKIGYKILYHSPARYDSPEQPVVKMLLETCQEYLGKRFKPYAMGGGTHSRIFPRSIPFGVDLLQPDRKKNYGDPHGPDESVFIDDLINAIPVYTAALIRLDQMMHSSASDL